MIAVAKAKLFATQTRTGHVGSALCILGGGQRHHIGRWPVPLQELSHRLHGGARVLEEQFEAYAEVVVARIAVTGECKPIFRAAPVA